MIAPAFPRYFAIGSRYYPLRGYIRCDSEHAAVLVVPSGSDECPIPLRLVDCLDREEARRLSETTAQVISAVNARWEAYRRLHPNA